MGELSLVPGDAISLLTQLRAAVEESVPQGILPARLQEDLRRALNVANVALRSGDSPRACKAVEHFFPLVDQLVFHGDSDYGTLGPWLLAALDIRRALFCDARLEGTIEDPAGDAFNWPALDPDPDLVAVEVEVFGHSVVLSARFAPGTLDPTTTWLYVLLDTDQDPGTGYPGTDGGCLNDAGLLGSEVMVVVSGQTGLPRVSSAPVGCGGFGRTVLVGAQRAAADRYDVVLPSWVITDDGRLNFKAITGLPVAVLDYASDPGLPVGMTR